jgi:hypothetical protein
MTAQGFTVTSPTLGIVEFLPHISVPRYRIEVELCHDHGSYQQNKSWVGVTFTGRHVPSPEGGHHVVANASFNDWEVLRLAAANGLIESKCSAQLELRWYLDTPPDGEFSYPQEMQYPRFHKIFFPPVWGAWKPWRNLTVEVGPAEAVADWGADPAVRIGTLERGEFARFSGNLLKHQAAVRRITLGPLEERRVGVMVVGGQCTVRRLRVVPLPLRDEP